MVEDKAGGDDNSGASACSFRVVTGRAVALKFDGLESLSVSLMRPVSDNPAAPDDKRLWESTSGGYRFPTKNHIPHAIKVAVMETIVAFVDGLANRTVVQAKSK